jgi:hypothetical protein
MTLGLIAAILARAMSSASAQTQQQQLASGRVKHAHVGFCIATRADPNHHTFASVAGAL